MTRRWLRRLLHRHEWALNPSIVTGFICLSCGRKRLASSLYEIDQWFMNRIVTLEFWPRKVEP